MAQNHPAPALEQLAEAPIPTRHGRFDLRVYRWDDPDAHPALSKEHCALIMGDLRGRRNVPVRVHSECLTSEVFGSLKCDCREQLERAQAEIAKRGFGAVLYLRQEGRGIGLANKVRAYALQAEGADTVAANEQLHLPVDARTYDVAAAMLRELGVESVEIMTNNPAKVEALKRLGIVIERRVPVLVPATPFSAGYLETKRRLMQHELPSSPLPNTPPDPETSNGRKRSLAS
ncbi:MAG TPA: GTP cyclohydrolase II [Polyangiaceae bacterium]|nr:GTP cyclohydrolase II [Polyangiaceae bacterium]